MGYSLCKRLSNCNADDELFSNDGEQRQRDGLHVGDVVGDGVRTDVVVELSEFNDLSDGDCIYHRDRHLIRFVFGERVSLVDVLGSSDAEPVGLVVRQRVSDAVVVGLACALFDGECVADDAVVSDFYGEGDSVGKSVVDGRERNGVDD